MKTKSSKRSVMKWGIVSILSVALVVGGFFGLHYYKDYQADRVYSKGETISFPDFDITITKAEYKAVNYPLDSSKLNKYGDLNSPEDCESKSNDATWSKSYIRSWTQDSPSERLLCKWRNETRTDIKQYISNNSQLVVDYKITAKNNIDTSRLKIELLPDSGRSLKSPRDFVEISDILSSEGREIITMADAPGPVYRDSYASDYIPYHQSKIGGDINKGLERTGHIYTDIRNSEKNVDIKITYKDQTRLVRISR